MPSFGRRLKAVLRRRCPILCGVDVNENGFEEAHFSAQTVPYFVADDVSLSHGERAIDTDCLQRRSR